MGSISIKPFQMFIFLGILGCFQFVNAQDNPVLTSYSSYRPRPYCQSTEPIRYPTTTNEVIGIVKEAIDRDLTVKAFGTRHSQTDIICTEGIPVDITGLEEDIMELNPENNTVTFGTGVKLFQATEFLRKNGRALKTTPQYGNITLGGAIATGAHGSTLKYNTTLSSQVINITVVDGEGNLRIVDTESDLNAFRINLGLLGILTKVTLVTVPLYKSLAHNYVVKDDILTNGVAVAGARKSDLITLYWFPYQKEVVVANWTFVDVKTPGNAFTYDHVPSTYEYFNIAGAPGLELAQTAAASTCPRVAGLGYTILHVAEKYLESTLYKQTPAFVPIYTEDGVTIKNPAVGFYDMMVAPTCRENNSDGQGLFSLQCVWAHNGFNITILDNEIAIELKHLASFIRTVKDIITKAPGAFPLFGVVIRFSEPSNNYLSISYGRETFNFEFYVILRKDKEEQNSASLSVFQTILQVAVNEFDGHSHWAKSGMVYQSTPVLANKINATTRALFQDVMNEYDPNRVFMNHFGERLLLEGTTLDYDREAITRCAMLDYCFPESDEDCGPTQETSKLPGYNYTVCRTQNEDKAIPFIVVDPVLPSNFTAWLSGVVPGLIQAATTLCGLIPIPFGK